MNTPLKTLIIGSSGFLGHELYSQLNTLCHRAHATDRTTLDLTKPIPASFQTSIEFENYDYVILCAAITDVEQCYKQQDLSNLVNVVGTRRLLECIARTKAIPIFFSSDYVFKEGTSPRKEGDLREPATVYGKQKLAIEMHIESNFQRYLIFRTSKLMSKAAKPRNILYPVIQALQFGKSVRIFEDQWLNPVFVEDIGRAILAAHRTNLSGTFHLGTRRIFSRAELGVLLARSFGFDFSLIEPFSMAQVSFSEPRPHYNTLDCQKFETAAAFRFTEVEEALSDREVAQNLLRS